jgi:integrase
MDCHTPGKRYRCNFQRSFQFVCKKAGLPWVTPHILRHSWITNLLKARVPIAKVSQWAGHRSIMVTADVYGHLQTYDSDIDKL